MIFLQKTGYKDLLNTKNAFLGRKMRGFFYFYRTTRIKPFFFLAFFSPSQPFSLYFYSNNLPGFW